MPKFLINYLIFGLFTVSIRVFCAEDSDLCKKQLSSLPQSFSSEQVEQICHQAEWTPSCKSSEGQKIFHFNFHTSSSGLKILVLSMIHGDENNAGVLARDWIQRLTGIKSRNQWRVIPLLNPDGFYKKTRMNGHGVDLNRNFPTQDWDKDAKKYWTLRSKSDPRRYPGEKAGSEAEVQCLLKQIEDYKPDFVISIHSPYGVLDFDGPHIRTTGTWSLPWKNLGNFPGSLGRYLWVDRNIPVLTVELKGDHQILGLSHLEKLQDALGTLAIRAVKESKSQME